MQNGEWEYSTILELGCAKWIGAIVEGYGNTT